MVQAIAANMAVLPARAMPVVRTTNRAAPQCDEGTLDPRAAPPTSWHWRARSASLTCPSWSCHMDGADLCRWRADSSRRPSRRAPFDGSPRRGPSPNRPGPSQSPPPLPPFAPADDLRSGTLRGYAQIPEARLIGHAASGQVTQKTITKFSGPPIPQEGSSSHHQPPPHRAQCRSQSIHLDRIRAPPRPKQQMTPISRSRYLCLLPSSYF